MYWIWTYGRRLSLLATSEHPASSTAAARVSQLTVAASTWRCSVVCFSTVCHPGPVPCAAPVKQALRIVCVQSLSPRPCALSVYCRCHPDPATFCVQSLSPRTCALCVYSPCHPDPAHCLFTVPVTQTLRLSAYSPCHPDPAHFVCTVPVTQTLRTVCLQSLIPRPCALSAYSPCHPDPAHFVCTVPVAQTLRPVFVQSLSPRPCALPVYSPCYPEPGHFLCSVPVTQTLRTFYVQFLHGPWTPSLCRPCPTEPAHCLQVTQALCNIFVQPCHTDPASISTLCDVSTLAFRAPSNSQVNGTVNRGSFCNKVDLSPSISSRF